jgi:hypothetical protein
LEKETKVVPAHMQFRNLEDNSPLPLSQHPISDNANHVEMQAYPQGPYWSQEPQQKQLLQPIQGIPTYVNQTPMVPMAIPMNNNGVVVVNGNQAMAPHYVMAEQPVQYIPQQQQQQQPMMMGYAAVPNGAMPAYAAAEQHQ